MAFPGPIPNESEVVNCGVGRVTPAHGSLIRGLSPPENGGEMMNPRLPPICAAAHPETKKLIFIKAGFMGYWPGEKAGIVDAYMAPDKWNRAHGISKAEAEAMLIGSMFGWDVPGADPENYDAEGRFISPDRSVR